MVKKVSKNQKQKATLKDPKEKGSRENAILQALKENPQGLIVEKIGVKAKEDSEHQTRGLESCNMGA